MGRGQPLILMKCCRNPLLPADAPCGAGLQGLTLWWGQEWGSVDALDPKWEMHSIQDEF